MAKYEIEYSKYNPKTKKYIKSRTVKINNSTSYDRFLKNKLLDKKDGCTNIRIKKEQTPLGYRVTKYSGFDPKQNEKFVAHLVSKKKSITKRK